MAAALVLAALGCGKEESPPPNAVPPAATRGLDLPREKAAGRTAYAKQYAILVGIDRYPADSGLEPLLFAVNDARETGALLSEEFGYTDCVLLKDGDASALAIRRAFDDLDRAGPDDAVLFFFSGHGFVAEGEGYLAAADSRREALTTCIAVTWLRERMAAMPCRHKLVLLDSCYSGSLFREKPQAVAPEPVPGAPGTRGEEGSGSAPVQDPLVYYFREPAFWGMSAGRFTPVADGLGADRHSVFTAALLHAMRERVDTPRRDHAFTFRQLAALVETKVANALRSAQIPDWGKLGPGDGDFVFRPTVQRATPTESRAKEEGERRKAQARERLKAGEMCEAAVLFAEANAKREDGAARCNARSLLAHVGAIRGVVPLPAQPLPIRLDPKGNWAVVGLSNGQVVRCMDRSISNRIDAGTGAVVADWSPNGQWIAAGADEPRIRLLRLDGSMNLSLDLPDRAMCVRFSPDGTRLLAAAKGGTVSLFDVAQGGRIASLPGEGGGVLSMRLADWSRDGSRILVGGYETLQAYDADLKEVLGSVHMSGVPVTSIARGSDGVHVFIGAGRTAACIDLEAARPTIVRDDPQQITAIHQVPDRVWIGKADGAVQAYSLDDFSPLGPPLRFPGCVMGFDLSDDGTVMAAAVLVGGKGAVCFRDLPAPPSLLVSSEDAPLKEAILLDAGSRIAVRGEDDVWSVEGVRFEGDIVPGAGPLVVVFHSGSARIWNADTKAWVGELIPCRNMLVRGESLYVLGDDAIERRILATGVRQGAPVKVACDMFDVRDGSLLITSGRTVSLRAAETGEVSHSRDFDEPILGATFVGDAIRVLHTDWARLWVLDARTLQFAPVQEALDRNAPHQFLRREADFKGAVAAVRSGSSLETWEIGTWRRLGAAIALDGDWRDFSLSPDGWTLLVETSAPSFRLFDARTGEPRAPAVPAPATLGSCAFAPDGALLAVPWKDAERNLRFYDTATGDGLEHALTYANASGLGNVHLQFSPDGSRLLAVRTSLRTDEEGWALFDVSLLTAPEDAQTLLARARRATGLRLGPDGTSVEPIPPDEWK